MSSPCLISYSCWAVRPSLLALGGRGSPPGPRHITLNTQTTAVCVLFFIDFCTSLWRADDRRRYLFTWGWLDLLSSCDARCGAVGSRRSDARLFRVLRGMRATTLLGRALLQHQAQTGILAAALLAVVLLVGSSISIWQVETDVCIQHQGPRGCALVGPNYDDDGRGRRPLSSHDRRQNVVAGVLMCAGVGLFGMFSGYLASVFVAPSMRTESAELRRNTCRGREAARRVRAEKDRP